MFDDPLNIENEEVYEFGDEPSPHTTEPWQVHAAELNISVFDDQAQMWGVIKGNRLFDVQPWPAGGSAAVRTAIKDVLTAAEQFRQEFGAYLDAIDPTNLEAALQGYNPPIDWNSLRDDRQKDLNPEWERVRSSPQLRRLAYTGHQLYKTCFGKRRKSLRDSVDILPPGSFLRIAWLHSAPGYIASIPWTLMYRSNPESQVDPTEFLGLRYRIQHDAHSGTVRMLLGDLADTYRGHGLYWGDMPQAIAEEVVEQKRIWSRWQNHVLVPEGTSGLARDELIQLLKAPPLKPMPVVYLYCVCSFDENHGVTLEFARTDDSSGLLRAQDLDPEEFADRPLIFVNACDSAAAEQLDLINPLEKMFFDAGCRAFIGAVSKVPVRLASRFASTFFEFLCHGISGKRVTAGEAVTQARLLLWNDYRNIGGLFYSYLNHHDLYLLANDD